MAGRAAPCSYGRVNRSSKAAETATAPSPPLPSPRPSFGSNPHAKCELASGNEGEGQQMSSSGTKFDYSDDLTRARRLQMRSDILKDTAALEQPRCSRARDFLHPVLPNLGGRRKRLFTAKHYSINNDHFLPNTSIRRVKILHA
ncbi:hypothetical protein V9T40_011774 [Parthenolecanium corni]|uniref:Uncharacterized protein n=1 Tax=Parthenolecanium corni TaxID=536013 RepID=A0AAN9T627_9HEMI